MPRHIRNIVRYGNALLVLLFALGALALLSKGQAGGAVVSLGLLALAVFNIYVVEKASRLLSEEEWLKAELRKAELRQKLATMTGASPPGPPAGMN